MTNLIPLVHFTALLTAAILIFVCLVGTVRCHTRRWIDSSSLDRK